MGIDTSRFVSLVVKHARKYNREILARFLEGKLYDSKLTWWWFLYTTGKGNLSILFKELQQESRLQDTKESKNPVLRRRVAGS
jgi:hypothetical protein